MFRLLERARTANGVTTKWVRESATRIAEFSTYEAAEAAKKRIARDPWRRSVVIVSMRTPGEIATLHAQHMEDAAEARRIGALAIAKEALLAAKAVRIGLA